MDLTLEGLYAGGFGRILTMAMFMLFFFTAAALLTRLRPDGQTASAHLMPLIIAFIVDQWVGVLLDEHIGHRWICNLLLVAGLFQAIVAFWMWAVWREGWRWRRVLGALFLVASFVYTLKTYVIWNGANLHDLAARGYGYQPDPLPPAVIIVVVVVFVTAAAYGFWRRTFPRMTIGG